MTTPTIVGHITAIWRYPVKSMGGERLSSADVDPGGIAGDRRFALIDRATGKVASAKNPKKWPGLLNYSARFENGNLEIALPDGSIPVDIDATLSETFQRPVTLASAQVGENRIEVTGPGGETEELLPAGSFFDLAPLHLLTTATLQCLSDLQPGSQFDPRRFRPNLVIETLNTLAGFVEDRWVGQTLRIGETVRLRVTTCCSRCIMTTLKQPGCSSDPVVLRTAMEFNGADVGVYAEVIGAGSVREGDAITLEG